MTEIRVGPDDAYPDVTLIRFSLDPTPVSVDGPNGETVTAMAQASIFRLCDEPFLPPAPDPHEGGDAPSLSD